MQVKKFDFNRDYDKCIQFLTDCYRENGNMTCWLPQRFDDLIFRVVGIPRHNQLSDFIYLFEEKNQIIGLVIPDDAAFNSCIRKGYEHIYPQMLDLAEEELLPVMERDEKGQTILSVVSHESLTYQAVELEKRGYIRQAESDYDNVLHPLENDYPIQLPKGFYQSYGKGFSDGLKAQACHYGFHPEFDTGVLIEAEDISSYLGRKRSRYFNDSIESLIVTDEGDICSYCFCYVDKVTSTGFIEPVSTRKKYRNMGCCRNMIYGVIKALKEKKIKNAYINSYDWRRKVYNHVGFMTEDTKGYWKRLSAQKSRQRY